jgi:hypothetical protein
MSEDQNIEQNPDDRQAAGLQEDVHDELPVVNEEQQPGKYKQQPGNMEVHHHPHVHHSKKWKDYLFEFLMLFLAVAAGFFMENLREHQVEKERAKEYAVSLYGDLVRDTSDVKNVHDFMQLAIAKLDTLKKILNNEVVDEHSTAMIYELSLYAFANRDFTGKTSTIDQLKNSGSLRYFRNTELISAFTSYDTKLQSLQKGGEVNYYVIEEIRKFLAQFLDLAGIPGLARSDYSILPVAPGSPALKLYNTDPALLHQYANWCTLKQIDLKYKIKSGIQLLNASRTLIQSLQKEFDVK